MSLRFIHIVARVHTRFLFRVEQYSGVWIDHVLCISAGRLGCPYLLLIVNNAALYTRVHVSAWTAVSFLLGPYRGVELQATLHLANLATPEPRW